MATELILKTEQDRQRLLKVVSCMDISKPLRFSWRLYKESRSLSQKGLYFTWCGVISEDTGETKQEVHERLKENFLVPIYERDDPEYREMLESLRDVYRQGMKRQAEAVFKKIVVKKTSTNDADVDQFTEYLNEVEMDALSNNIVLPHPDDYCIAMGRAA